jgi:hypothetical protein
MPGTTRFLASLRNDSGGVIKSFALPGTTRFLASAKNDREKKEMTVVGIAIFLRWSSQPSTWSKRFFGRSSRPSSAVISNAVRDLLPRKEGFLAGARYDKGALDMIKSTIGMIRYDVSSIFVHQNSCHLQMTQLPVYIPCLSFEPVLQVN